MNLQSNDFELLGLSRRFAQEQQAITDRWKTLQAQVHPDRFSSASPAEQRVAMQWSVRVNEAYQRLRDPLKRAIYLCELNNYGVGAEDNTAMPAQFLMQQMEWLEALDEASNVTALEPIHREVQDTLDAIITATAKALDEQDNYPAAVDNIRSWMFLSKFMSRIEQRRRQLQAA